MHTMTNFTSRRFALRAQQLVLALALMCASSAVPAQHADRTGKEVVEASCVACHGNGNAGAPKIGDQKAWSKLSARGLSSLRESALKGIRNMPAHGGNPDFSDTEIARAITYMVNQSGGHWTEPVSRTTVAHERTGAEIVKAQCSQCHATGKYGAPKIGDKAAWIPRMKQGFDVVVRSAINGHGAMPPRGGMSNLTDAEIRSAITYMFQAAEKP
jgi:cytochrome c5